MSDHKRHGLVLHLRKRASDTSSLLFFLCLLFSSLLMRSPIVDTLPTFLPVSVSIAITFHSMRLPCTTLAFLSSILPVVAFLFYLGVILSLPFLSTLKTPCNESLCLSSRSTSLFALHRSVSFFLYALARAEYFLTFSSVKLPFASLTFFR